MTYTKQQAQRQFQGWSRSYDRSVLQWLYFGPSHDLLLEHLDQLPSRAATDRRGCNLRVLDIGCGTGRFAQRIGQRDSVQYRVRFCGLDFCKPMIDQAVARDLPRESFTWVQAESQHLPFEDNTFDAVTCVHSFHHYPDQPQAVREMFRVLVPGGQAMILDGYRDRPWGWFIYDVMVVAVEGKVHHASAGRFRDLFTAAGFVDIDQQPRTGLTPMLLTKGTVPLPQSLPETKHSPELVQAST